ncbi:unnamed protein product [Acanthosepion pharaonis]|uniref:Uncharacterized protein n=1 Tax=Acanthosepion pharaonis TaxID=158019 RepID=A0A812EIX0_ACAPH|nr:unnamed protein product [Sepia pharaonis]
MFDIWPRDDVFWHYHLGMTFLSFLQWDDFFLFLFSEGHQRLSFLLRVIYCSSLLWMTSLPFYPKDDIFFFPYLGMICFSFLPWMTILVSSLDIPSSVRHSSLFLDDFPVTHLRHSSLFLNDFEVTLHRDDFFYHSYVEEKSSYFFPWDDYFCFSFIKVPYLLLPSWVRYSSHFLDDFPVTLLCVDFFYHSYVDKRLCISFLGKTTLVFPSSICLLCSSFLSTTFFAFLNGFPVSLLRDDIFYQSYVEVTSLYFFPWNDYFCFSFIKMSSLLFPYAVRHSSIFLDDFPVTLLPDDIFYHSYVE